MRFTKKDILKLEEHITKANKITVITHYNPDGDALGSSVALYHYLKTLNKDCLCLIPNPYPSNLEFVLEDTDFIIAEKSFKNAKQRLLQTDLLFLVDMNNNSRCGDNLEKVLNELSCTKILIDHHLKPDAFALNFSYPESSATCEVLYNILKRLTKRKVFSEKISKALYLGLITDTGSLSYSNDNPEIYSIISNLLKSGLKASKLHQKIFDTYSVSRLRLLGYAISHKMKVFSKERAAFISLSKEELKRYNYQTGDLEGVVNYSLKLAGVDFCALLSERDDKIRMSFRSKDPSIDVNLFARKFWNGGGHVMASGGKSYEKLSEVERKLTAQIKNKSFLNND
ncbi:MAG: bifunctional oligoribonuclease/PAP phosphatase NrnA [Bacteroidales bacterium]|nr:bifunctional oligoribonuclease/PAP phosphatase NrnA [Bacteroidales bacterium]